MTKDPTICPFCKAGVSHKLKLWSLRIATDGSVPDDPVEPWDVLVMVLIGTTVPPKLEKDAEAFKERVRRCRHRHSGQNTAMPCGVVTDDEVGRYQEELHET